MGKVLDWIFFDLGNVLCRLDFSAVWNGFIKETGRDIDIVKKALYDDNLFNAFEKGRISPEQYYRGVCRIMECSMEYEKFVDIWNSIVVPDPEMINFALKLKEIYRILVLSNTNVLNASVLEADVNRLADEIVYSYEVGYMKPEKEIYEIALERAGAEPEAVLFVDDLKENLESASKLGINVYQFDTKANFYRFLTDQGFLENFISEILF